MIVEAIIVAIGICVGLSRIANALDNVAVGIEQHGLQVAAAFSDHVEEE